MAISDGETRLPGKLPVSRVPGRCYAAVLGWERELRSGYATFYFSDSRGLRWHGGTPGLPTGVNDVLRHGPADLGLIAERSERCPETLLGSLPPWGRSHAGQQECDRRTLALSSRARSRAANTNTRTTSTPTVTSSVKGLLSDAERDFRPAVSLREVSPPPGHRLASRQAVCR